MAETGSIASRIEELARLKRLKLEKVAREYQAAGGLNADGHMAPVSQVAETPLAVDEDTTDYNAAFEKAALQNTAAPVSRGKPKDPKLAEFENKLDTLFEVLTLQKPEADGTGNAESGTVPVSQNKSEQHPQEDDRQNLRNEFPTGTTGGDTAAQHISHTAFQNGFPEEQAIPLPEVRQTPNQGADNAFLLHDAEADNAPGVKQDAHSALDNIAALQNKAAASTAATAPDTPDFSQEDVDAEIIEHEFTKNAGEENTAHAETGGNEDQISVRFDSSRSVFLNHVALQMECSVDDVVVTAVDWYLDALFGDGEKDDIQSA